MEDKQLNLTLKSNEEQTEVTSIVYITGRTVYGDIITATTSVIQESSGPVITYELVVTPSSESITYTGTTQLKATYYVLTNGVRDAGTDVTSSATWTSENTTYADVVNGKVTGKNITINSVKVIIRARYSDLSDVCEITVGIPPKVWIDSVTNSYTVINNYGENIQIDSFSVQAGDKQFFAGEAPSSLPTGEQTLSGTLTDDIGTRYYRIGLEWRPMSTSSESYKTVYSWEANGTTQSKTVYSYNESILINVSADTVIGNFVVEVSPNNIKGKLTYSSGGLYIDGSSFTLGEFDIHLTDGTNNNQYYWAEISNIPSSGKNISEPTSYSKTTTEKTSTFYLTCSEIQLFILGENPERIYVDLPSGSGTQTVKLKEPSGTSTAWTYSESKQLLTINPGDTKTWPGGTIKIRIEK